MLSRFLFIFCLVGKAGVTGVCLNLGGNHQDFNGAVTPILKQTSCYLANFLEDNVRCPGFSQPFRTHHGLDGIAMA